MDNLSPEVKEFLLNLERKEKMVAMLAPSFPVVFSYPGIVGKLKRLGFTYVVEVSRGAAETNRQLLDLIKKNPKDRYITSPCPTIVRLIRNKYPHLIQYLAPTDSPMAATAKLVFHRYPNYRPVFIGPCPAKKVEAREDHSRLGIIALTYIEMEKILEMKSIREDPGDFLASFDILGAETRLYPVSSGLSQSSGLAGALTDEELDVISGLKNVEEALRSFPTNRLKVLDILYCDGGCISGPGIISNLTLDKRRAKVITHWMAAINRWSIP